MVFYYRKNIQTSDVLESPDISLRIGFTRSGKTIGKFSSGENNTTAHILHTRPLLIGAISKHDTGTFYPESPGLYGKYSDCKLKIRHETNDYSVYECDNLSGAIYYLDATYPKVYPKDKPVVLAFDNEKVVTDQPIVGGIVTKLGTNEFYEVVGEGKRISVEELAEVYDKAVWPVAKRYFKDIRSHYFTYFREYQAKNKLEFTGLSGTRDRVIQGNIRNYLFRVKMWNYIKSLFGY
jgi:hypothetical protein